jgi:hypothetical protein
VYVDLLSCVCKLLVLVKSKKTDKVLYQSSPAHGNATRQLPQTATSLGQCIGLAKSGAPTHQSRPSSLSRCSRALWPPGHLHSPAHQHLDAQCNRRRRTAADGVDSHYPLGKGGRGIRLVDEWATATQPRWRLVYNHPGASMTISLYDYRLSVLSSVDPCSVSCMGRYSVRLGTMHRQVELHGGPNSTQ